MRCTLSQYHRLSYDRANGCDSDCFVRGTIRPLGYDGSFRPTLRDRSCHSPVRRPCIWVLGTNCTSGTAYNLRYHGVFVIEDGPTGMAACSFLHCLRNNFLIHLDWVVQGTCTINRAGRSLLYGIRCFVGAYLPASEQILDSPDAVFGNGDPAK